MRGVTFFSGGKDGLYALYLAEKRGIKVPYLLALKTSIGLSPHWENFDALKIIANAMGKTLLTFDMAEGGDSLARFIASLEVDYLIAGDIFLEEHLKWVEWLAEKAGVRSLEPLWGRNTLELAEEILNTGFEYAIIAVNKEKLGKDWLGYKFSSLEDLDVFLDKNPAVDPLGERGEFHTVTLSGPLFRERFKLEKLSIEKSEKYWWLRFKVMRDD
ncbi:MAG: diphthine-ammonia ligase [Thermococcaceae archaeon]|uniref:PAB0415 family putative ATP pyrophosphatase n=1 Tax=Thermococcus TaxID=2263 RepID=UPI0005B2CEF1|nr:MULTISPECIES: diphthine--ammonia ligase [Thermococcus]MCA6214032.1 diphthine--ammonia ligase [Thermococcus bergensis]MDK2982924.1 diphthine-ammonia ligase [Thermococcaceae archaeon]MDN5319696.1 diphthine-ammonia ligase [Thermococcaceae archaeon]